MASTATAQVPKRITVLDLVYALEKYHEELASGARQLPTGPDRFVEISGDLFRIAGK